MPCNPVSVSYAAVTRGKGKRAEGTLRRRDTWFEGSRKSERERERERETERESKREREKEREKERKREREGE